ncbi:hypothetical protein ITJ38_00225 [Agreia pratensis]|uniref:Uncharacterized protein n=1 Tax=Agreia pratensis TaxID=150121 RepID=A0A1X7IWB5_9MICO|nr:hypothetical protein [Agreia pratensis]MBF4632825.1 hypothetical protein [Agreia pratensis]SMG18806.1 hypothetical protein SAMN06296010_0892 [Agreia pratensis]
MTTTAHTTPSAPAVQTQRLVSFLVDGARLTIRRVEEFDGSGPAGIAVSWTVDDLDASVGDSTDRGAVVHRGPQ